MCFSCSVLPVQLDIIQASRTASDMFLVMLERFKTPSVMRAYAHTHLSFCFLLTGVASCYPFLLYCVLFQLRQIHPRCAKWHKCCQRDVWQCKSNRGTQEMFKIIACSSSPCWFCMLGGRNEKEDTKYGQRLTRFSCFSRCWFLQLCIMGPVSSCFSLVRFHGAMSTSSPIAASQEIVADVSSPTPRRPVEFLPNAVDGASPSLSIPNATVSGMGVRSADANISSLSCSAGPPVSTTSGRVCYCVFTVDRHGMFVEADAHSPDMFCFRYCLSSCIILLPYVILSQLPHLRNVVLVSALKNCFIIQSPSFFPIWIVILCRCSPTLATMSLILKNLLILVKSEKVSLLLSYLIRVTIYHVCFVHDQTSAF